MADDFDKSAGSAAPISVISGPPPNQQNGSEMDALLLGRTRELVAASPERRNWRGIFIALLVIAAVFSLIIFSIFLLSPEDEGTRIRGKRMILQDIVGKSLRWKPFNGTWTNDVELVYRDPSGGLSVLNLENYTTRILMTNSTFRQLNAESFIVSPDQKYVLVVSDSSPEGSKYNVFEVQTRNRFPLAQKENTPDAPRLQLVLWAPNSAGSNSNSISNSASQQSNSGKLLSTLNAASGQGNLGATGGNSGKVSSQGIAFVHDNDLYYKPKVQGDLVCRITTNGEADVIFNGIPDWLYGNVPELKSDTVSFSPDGQYLSFLSFNDSLVREYKYTWMGDSLKYPSVRSVRYPKTGTINPNVTIYVVNLSVLKYIFPQQIKLPASASNGSYVGAMIWSSPTDLSVTVTDREQTKAMTVMCRAPTFVCRELHTEVTISDGWLLPAEKPIFSKHSVRQTTLQPLNSSSPSDQNNGKDLSTFEMNPDGYILKRLPVRDGDHGHYRHVVFISTSDKRTIPITMGRYEVTEIVGWDEPNETVYFMAAPEGKPGQRHLYKLNLRFNIPSTNRVYITPTQPLCLTCDNRPTTYKIAPELSANRSDSEEEDCLSYDIPNNCLFNKIFFSRDYSYYVQECLGPDPPSVYLVETSTNNKIFILHAGDSLRRKLNQLALPQIRSFSVEIRHGFHAQVRLFLPPGMKEEEEVAFPVVLQIDAAPGSQLVSERFKVDWNWYLCSQRSIIIAQIDARGSGYQGELLRTQIHGKLGTVEIEDQLGVLTYLRDSLKFIDPTRICAYGWGYGGYAATMTLIEDSQEVLQCSIAINPIVSFGYHYSFFTERYIPLSGDYLRALQEADLTMKAGNIKSRNYMVIHGTADTLVHQEHSLMFARSLIEQEVKFRHQVYTDEDHNMSGSLVHLYKTIEWYIDESFGPQDDNEWDPAGFFAFKQ